MWKKRNKSGVKENSIKLILEKYFENICRINHQF